MWIAALEPLPPWRRLEDAGGGGPSDPRWASTGEIVLLQGIRLGREVIIPWLVPFSFQSQITTEIGRKVNLVITLCSVPFIRT